MKYFTHLITAAIFFYIGFTVRQCSYKPCPEIIESVDTVYKDLPEVKKETVNPKAIRIYPAKNTQRNFKEDSLPENDLPNFGNLCNDINIYSDTLEDSTGRIIVYDSIRGELLKQKILYKPKISFIKETKIVKWPVPQSGVFVGIEAGFSLNKTFRIAPEISYLNKKGVHYSYNYDLIGEIHSLGVGKRLF